jgi:hypothetical protein
MRGGSLAVSETPFCLHLQVQHYTPDYRGPSKSSEQDDTPLWSNAGHTPYSLATCSTAGQCAIRSLSFEADTPEPTAGMAKGGKTMGCVMVSSVASMSDYNIRIGVWHTQFIGQLF